MCLFPKLIFNPKYKENKKNGGQVPAVSDVRTLYVPVGCGNCIECRKKKARSWQVRLLEDLKEHKNGKFITLTFSNESIRKLYDELHRTVKWSIDYNYTLDICKAPRKDKSRRLRQRIIKRWHERKEIKEGYNLDNYLATRAVRLFLERWRKVHKKSLRHWLVTELGHEGTENIHLHGIVWTDININEVERLWQYGFVWKGKLICMHKHIPIYENYVNEKTVNYITKYVSKMDILHKKYKAVTLTSAGIGRCFRDSYNAKQNKYKGTDTQEYYRTRQGYKIAMPIYWRNKIYNDEEREKLWIQKLDKQERWVLGKRVDVSKSQEEYYNALLYAQEINKQLGYGRNNDDKTEWNRNIYEQERRKLIQQVRLNNNNKT